MQISCIIPAFNEEKTIAHVVSEARKVRSITEVIVLDDGSTDRTAEIAERAGAKVHSHKDNKGKGASIKTAIVKSRGDILVFLDADLPTISARKISAMLKPIENDDADFVKASFSRSRGRVTELVVKPLFRVIFPFADFSQPLSGQFAVRKKLLQEMRIHDQWGVDIQILLKLVKKGVRIREVDIGPLVHKKQPLERLAVMSEQVIKTILSELDLIANKHKLIIFDFDKTIINESSIELVADTLGFSATLKELRKSNRAGKLPDYMITLQLARCLKGISSRDLAAVARKLTLTKNISKVIQELRKRQYKIAIVSVAFEPVIRPIALRLSIPEDMIICPTLPTDKQGRFTGEVIAMTKHQSSCCDRIICKADGAKELMRRLAVNPEECIAVADGKSDECLFRQCGLSLAFRPVKPMGDIVITNMAEILIHSG